MNRLARKVAMVTGASKGIGSGMQQRLQVKERASP